MKIDEQEASPLHVAYPNRKTTDAFPDHKFPVISNVRVVVACRRQKLILLNFTTRKMIVVNVLIGI